MNTDCLYIVMPAYNEESNIESVVKQWHPIVEKIANNSKLLVVNDGSKDSTLLILNQLKNKFPHLLVVDKPNSGHGPTLLYGYKLSIENGSDYIFQTDSDSQTNPEEFWVFWSNRANYDFQIGNRKARLDGFSRVIVSRVLKLMVWIIFRVSVKDANTPFRLMKVDKLVPILKIIPDDFFLSNVAITTIVRVKNEKLAWHTISFKPRQSGVNSINLRRIMLIGVKAIADFQVIKRRIHENE